MPAPPLINFPTNFPQCQHNAKSKVNLRNMHPSSPLNRAANDSLSTPTLIDQITSPGVTPPGPLFLLLQLTNAGNHVPMKAKLVTPFQASFWARSWEGKGKTFSTSISLLAIHQVCSWWKTFVFCLGFFCSLPPRLMPRSLSKFGARWQKLLGQERTTPDSLDLRIRR